MSPLEKFFGVKIEASLVLDPLGLMWLEEKVKQWYDPADFNPEDFFIYLNTIRISESREEFFGREIPMRERIERFDWEFRVNSRQQRAGLIKVRGLSVEDQRDEAIGGTASLTMNRSSVSGHLLLNDCYETLLIIGVSKRLSREKYRQLKLRAEVIPTDLFLSNLPAPKSSVQGFYDFRLTHDVRSILHDLEPKKKRALQQELSLLTEFAKDQPIEHVIGKLAPALNARGDTNDLSNPRNFSVATGSSVQLEVINEAVSKTFESALGFLTQRINESDLSTDDKAAATGVITRLSDLKEKIGQPHVLEHVEDALSLLRHDIEKSSALFALSYPVLNRMTEFFS